MMKGPFRRFGAGILAFGLSISPHLAHAEIDGYGPDAWRVEGVSADDTLNARMGPGTQYPVVETFAHNETRLQQITCEPFFTMEHFSAMNDAEIDALPARWCLMRSADLTKAGWVAAQFLVPDSENSVDKADVGNDGMMDVIKIIPAPTAGPEAWSDDALIEYARGLVTTLYEIDAQGQHPTDPEIRAVFFSTDFVAALQTRPPGADLLYGAQDFDGSVSAPTPDPDMPFYRGMITINVEIENFGRRHTAAFRLRGDDQRPDLPLRIMRIDHDGWSYP